MKRERKNRTEGSIDIAFCGILFPDEGQEELIRKTLGCKRFVYNLFLDERIKAYNEDKHSISYVDQQNQLPLMKQDPKTKWLSEVDSTALQNGVRDLQDAFDNFYDGLKTGEEGRIPEIQMQE